MPNKQIFKKLPGFTLLEVAIVLAAFLTISVIALPVAVNQIQTTRSISAMKDIRSAMFLTEQNAYTQKDNTDYGISFSENGYVIFKGASLATATDTESFDFTSDIVLENIDFDTSNELVFNKGSFRPVSAGFLDVRNGVEVYRVSISSEGLITSVKNND